MFYIVISLPISPTTSEPRREPKVNRTIFVPQKSPRRRFKFGSRITPAVAAFLSISHFEPPIPQPYVTYQIGVIGFLPFLAIPFPLPRYCIIRRDVCRAACFRLTQCVRESYEDFYLNAVTILVANANIRK